MIHLKARTIDSELVFVHCVALRQIDEKFFIPLPGESLSLYYYLKGVTLYIRTLLSFFRLFAFLSFSRPRGEDCCWNESFGKRRKNRRKPEKEAQRLIAIITALDSLLLGYKQRFQGNILGIRLSEVQLEDRAEKRAEFYSRQRFYGWQLYPSCL